VERRARAEIECLATLGCEVRALAQHAADDHARTRWPAVFAIHPEVAPPGRLSRTHTSTKMVAFLVESFRAMRRWTRDGGVDVVISHTPASVIGTWPWTRSTDRRAIYVCHTPPRPRGEPRRMRHRPFAQLLWDALERRTLRTADLVVCPSASSRDWYARYRPDKPTIALENPVDVSRFSPDEQAVRDIDVLFVGRLTAEKGPDVLLESVAMLDRPVRIVLVGQGRLHDRLVGLAARLPGECTVIARIDNDALPELYRRARVVAVPSFTEAGPVVPLEAMACGTPIVASAVTGLVDLVEDDGNGWLVPPGDAAALAEVLDRVLEDPHLTARAGSRAAAAHRMDHESFCATMPESYGIVGRERVS
jgi:glycosyltransferase involved in cell wall biosynthesis